MNRVVPLTLLLCMASWAMAPGAVAAELNYRLYVLGIPGGEAAFSLDLAAATYRMEMHFRTTGIADLLVPDRMEERTAGRFENDLPTPVEYGSNGRRHGEERIVNMV